MKPRLLFPTFTALVLWLGPAQNASATLLLDEPFTYANGVLETNAPGLWTNYSGAFYQILVSSDRAILSQSTNAEEVLTYLPGGSYGTNYLNAIYASLTVKCTTLPANGGTYFAQFYDTPGGASRARVFVTTNGASALHWRVGIANAATTTTNYFATNLVLSSLHRLVVRYNVGAGVANLWLDPASEADSSLLATDASSAVWINAFGLRQAPSTTNGVGVLQIDDLKIGDSFSEVTAVWDNRFTASTDSMWEDPANWSLGAPSGSQTGPLIANAPSKTITIDASTPGDYLTVSNLTVASPDASTTNTLLLDNAGLSNPLVVSNVFTLAAGGALALSNSALYLPGSALKPLRSPGFYVDGPVELDNSLVTATNVSILAGSVSGSSNGAITLDNSTLLAGSLVLGNADGAVGSLTMNSGLLTFPGGTNLLIGGVSNAVGALTINGGQLNSSSALVVGATPGSIGVVNVAGGTVTATNGVVQIGPAGSGQMNISGGNTIVTQLKLGGTTNGAAGALHLTGGHLQVLASLSVNAFGLDGGDLDGSGATVIVGELHDAAMVVSAGTATNIGTLLIGYSGSYTGTFTQDGGVVSVVTNVVVGDCVGGAVGSVTLDGGVFYVQNADHTAVFDVRNGTVVLNPGGMLIVDTLVITNACGHFLNNGGYLYAMNIVLDPNMDADGDGLPNWWEQAHGLDPLSALGNDGALGDPDGDGQSNLAEYEAGTDPQNPDSVLRMLGATVSGQDVRLAWTAVGGHSYVVQICTDVAGSASPRFVDCSGVINVDGAGECTACYTHVGGAASRGAFYRVRLGP